MGAWPKKKKSLVSLVPFTALAAFCLLLRTIIHCTDKARQVGVGEGQVFGAGRALFWNEA